MARKDGEGITSSTLVSGGELAVALGLSRRRIEQLQQDGIIVPAKKGAYALPEAVQQYIKFITGNQLDDEDRKREKALRASEVTMKSSKAIIEQMKADEMKGTMHRAEDVAAMTEDLIYTIRSALATLPGRVAVDVAAVNTSAEASEVIRKEVHKVMRELAAYHYDPKKYEERVRKRMDWSERDGDDE